MVVEAAKCPLPASCSVITRLVFAMRNVKCIDNILRCGHCGQADTAAPANINQKLSPVQVPGPADNAVHSRRGSCV